MCCMARFMEGPESAEVVAIIEPEWAGKLLRYVVLSRPKKTLLHLIVNCNPASRPTYPQAAACYLGKPNPNLPALGSQA